ncbi:MAG TPA: TadE family type IV pilus minor pilin [Candidatus Nanopelagicales bacterium]|jgi:hypothetical protein
MTRAAHGTGVAVCVAGRRRRAGVARNGRRAARSHQVAVGTRPAIRDSGAVTVEAAISLLAVVLVLTIVVWFVVVLAAQLRAVDAARAGARLAARAQPYADVRDEVHRIAPGVSVDVDHRASGNGGNRVVVTVHQRMTPPLGPLSGLGSVEVGGRATAWVESP